MPTLRQKRAKEAIEARNLKWWKHTNDTAYVYVVRSGDYYKVGITSFPESRISSLQCGNPIKLEMVFTIKLKDYKFYEDLTHWVLETRQHLGEWYRLNSGEVELLKSFLVDLSYL